MTNNNTKSNRRQHGSHQTAGGKKAKDRKNRPAASGSRPAGKNPHISASATSGRVFRKKRKKSKIEIHSPAKRRRRLAKSIKSGAGKKVSSRKTLPDVLEANSSCLTPAGGVPDSLAPCSIKGEIRIGVLHQPRESHELIVDANLLDLLCRANLPTDTVIGAGKETEITIVDADTHHLSTPPSHEALMAIATTTIPPPEAAWATHGDGLKIVYIGIDHRKRAVAAALQLPSFFNVEILKHTRHPGAASSDHPGRRCGEVRFFDTDPAAVFELHAAGKLTADGVKEALEKLRMEPGGRYDHDRCPIAPHSDSDAVDCVRVLDSGIHCYRCAAHGDCAPGLRVPGFLPFSSVVAGASTDLDRLAKRFVHWQHARLELRHFYPNLSESLLREAYEMVLNARHESDPRIRNVFTPNLDFVWGNGAWLNATTLAPTPLDNDAINHLPYVQFVATNKDGEHLIKTNTLLRSQVKSRTPAGYTSIRPFRGITFAPDAGCIPVLAEPRPKYPIRLLSEPIPFDQASQRITATFPGISMPYVQAALAAVICVETSGGQPPMLTCRGPNGSGKEQTIRLAASFMGEDIHKLPLTDDDEKLHQRVGAAIANGHRFLVFDEFGKQASLTRFLKPILQIGTVTNWRPFFRNEQRETATKATFFFTSARFPDYLSQSAEFLRRTRDVRLYGVIAPSWQETSGGDSAEWRDRNECNARIANSLLSHVWHLCSECAFQFFGTHGVASRLNLGSLADGDAGVDPNILRAIYRYARNECGNRVLFDNDSTFVRGWINLDAAPARVLISPLVPLDDADNLKQARRIAQANLESFAWNSVLDFAEPVACQVKIHGNRWGLRFIGVGPAPRGQEVINEQLPPCSIVTATPPPSGTTPPEPAAPERPQQPQPAPSTPSTDPTAAEVLVQAGMPS